MIMSGETFHDLQQKLAAKDLRGCTVSKMTKTENRILWAGLFVMALLEVGLI